MYGEWPGVYDDNKNKSFVDQWFPHIMNVWLHGNFFSFFGFIEWNHICEKPELLLYPNLGWITPNLKWSNFQYKRKWML